MTDTTPTAKRVEVTETGRVYIDRKPLPFKTDGATATITANGKNTRITLTIPVDGEVCVGGLGDPSEYPGVRRGRIAVMSETLDDAKATAEALDLAPGDWAAYTMGDNRTHGLIIRAAVATSLFTMRAADGNAYAYDVAARVRRDLVKYGGRG